MKRRELAVVFTDDYLRDGLCHFNRTAWQSGQPWIPVKPVGKVIWLGPLFIPGVTACWACLATRLRANRREQAFLRTRRGTSSSLITSIAMLPATLATASGMAATEVLRWIVQDDHHRLENTLLTFDSLTSSVAYHRVSRLPQCAVCGNPSVGGIRTSPLHLRSRKKTYTADGGHRTMPPEEAFARFEHLIDPLTGVLRDLRRLDASSAGLMHTYTLKHALVAVPDTLEKLRLNEYAGSSGKGKTEAQAKASALFEALERYASVWQGHEYRVTGSYHDMKPAALHPHSLLGFSSKQYAAREAWNRSYPAMALRIPEPFDESKAIEWVPVWSLTHEDVRYIPAAYSYFGYPDNSFCYADSNGNAAGITLEGAIVQGFFELVERDATAIWFYNRLRRPAVAPRSFEDPYFDTLLAYYRDTLNRDAWVLDVTSDLGIPCFVAISRRTDRHPEDIIMGFGCHLDPSIAAARALTELNQVLHGVPGDTPEGSTRYRVRDPLYLKWLQTATLADQPYLAPDETVPARTAAYFPRLYSDDLLEDISTCLKRAQACDLEVCVLDLTRPDLGLPVVKVVVPGLVHYWRRLGHRRLYDVPARMGGPARTPAEEEMNPWSIVT